MHGARHQQPVLFVYEPRGTNFKAVDAVLI